MLHRVNTHTHLQREPLGQHTATAVYPPWPALHCTDEELFLQATGYGPPAAMPKIDLTRHDIDSIMVDPLQGERQKPCTCTLLCTDSNHPQQAAFDQENGVGQGCASGPHCVTGTHPVNDCQAGVGFTCQQPVRSPGLTSALYLVVAQQVWPPLCGMLTTALRCFRTGCINASPQPRSELQHTSTMGE